MNTLLKNQIAIVTGATSGIGMASAIGLAKAGATVVVNYHGDKKATKEVLNKIKEFEGKAIAIKADVSVEEEVQDMFASTVNNFGRVDILVANAGIQIDEPLHKMSIESWSKVIEVNLTGQFICAREAIRLFLAQGVDASISKAAGKIIHISSVHDKIAWAGHANYAASKGGVKMLMETISQGYASDKIRCNSISPGAIKTKINEAERDTDEEVEEMLKMIPYGRIGDPEDISNAVTWLASDWSDYVNGETIYVDGGMKNYPTFKDN